MWMYAIAVSRVLRAAKIVELRLACNVPQDIDDWIETARAGWRPGDSRAATLRRAADAAH